MIRAATSTAVPTGAPPRVVTTPGTPAAPPRGGLLEPLHELPGLTRATLIDASGDHVIADLGDDEGTRDDTVAAVLAWGRRAATVAVDRELVLDDLIVTTDVAHHLLRRLDTPAAPGAWVYLRVRRDQGNLALARRRLAAVGVVRTLALEPARTPAPDPVPRPPAPAIPAAAAPVSTPASEPLSAPVSAAAPAPLSAPPSPSSPATRDRRTRSTSAPAPVPARTPASSPASAVPASPSAPSAPWPTRVPGRTRTTADAGPVAAAAPAGPPVLPAPRRPPGPSVPAAAPAAPIPPPDAAPRRVTPDSAGVLGQRWRSDPDTLRRVLAGLLRLGRTPQPALTGAPEGADPTTTPRSPGATPTRRNRE
ncbi:hypothetical protein Acsp06_02150 [Actinomycetospora sp. NBRC 106375]|uniref:hypothetical protein n=1 Tax=Actinomycetospora sp. NBRC 106375 TaxID=3032207 RepID=UPI0024A2B30A|nr:hypothetical protein [Actinomycetospora sp. NBRC 106375]GLZ44030.1 hypothetical protein Acsp06_02150 [Actinomycetospora sp. NBRC 106375]